MAGRHVYLRSISVPKRPEFLRDMASNTEYVEPVSSMAVVMRLGTPTAIRTYLGVATRDAARESV